MVSEENSAVLGINTELNQKGGIRNGLHFYKGKEDKTLGMGKYFFNFLQATEKKRIRS